MIDQFLSFEKDLIEEWDEIYEAQGGFLWVQNELEKHYTMLLDGFDGAIELASEVEELMKKFFGGVGTYKDYYNLRKAVKKLSSRVQQIRASIAHERDKQEREERRKKKNIWQEQQVR